MEAESTVRSCSIVLIDDDTVVHFIFGRLISHYCPHITFQCFSSASEVLELLKSKLLSVELIILDVNMPDMNGWAFLSELSRLELSNAVCMLSSSDDSRDVAKAKSFPTVENYFVKPLDREKIEQIIGVLDRIR